MEVLKGIGYTLAAILVLSAIAGVGLTVVTIILLVGAVTFLFSLVSFVSYAIRFWYETRSTRRDE